MKFVVAALAMTLASSAALANDGGQAAIKVSQIKMRQENSKGQVVEKFTKPNFTITISGGEAAKLQQILPSTVSVVTAMQPELAKSYAETFKGLGVYSDKSSAATSKVISINCADGELVSDKSDATGSKLKIVKHAQTECTISIHGMDSAENAWDWFGDVQTFAPKCSN